MDIPFEQSNIAVDKFNFGIVNENGGVHHLFSENSIPPVGRVIGLKIGIFKNTLSPAVKNLEAEDVLHIPAGIDMEDIIDAISIWTESIRNIYIAVFPHKKLDVITCLTAIFIGGQHRI